MQFLKLQIHFGGDVHEIVVPTNGDPTVAELHIELEKQFHVPKEIQRLHYKGQALHEQPDLPLRVFGINNSSLIRMVGRKGVVDNGLGEGQ